MGASSGVGRATAEILATHGCRLVLVARSRDALDDVVGACGRAGAQAIAVPTDIGRLDDVEALARAATDRFGVIDAWIEAAAVVVAGELGTEEPAEVHRLIATNVLGAYHGSRTALGVFRTQGHGHLVMIGSILGITPNPMVPTYVMSKFAVRGLALALQRSVAGIRDIDVSLVLPGPIDTPLFERAANHTGHRLRAIPPAYAPERVAAAIVACLRRPRHQITAGALSRLILVGHRIAPRQVEVAIAAVAGRTITRREAAPQSSGALFQPPATGEVHGGWRRSRARRRLGGAWGRALGGRGARRR